MFVVSYYFVGHPVGYHRQLAPASTDCGHILQKSSFAVLIVDAPEALFDSSLRSKSNRLASELRQTPRETFDLGVLDTKGHARNLKAAALAL
ncbi:hypothetical protein ABIB80_005867 [Bradyrhizobium sp. i1.15.2]